MKERKSMRGVSVDLGKLMAQQEKSIAVGNTKSNARGDQLGRAGRVVRSADDLAREHYNRNNPKAVAETTLKVDDVPFDVEEKFKEAQAAAKQGDDWEEPSVEKNKQTKASEKDAEATQKDVESVGSEKEQKSSGTETENNSQDIEEQQKSVAEEDDWVEDADGNFVKKSELESVKNEPVSKSKNSNKK